MSATGNGLIQQLRNAADTLWEQASTVGLVREAVLGLEESDENRIYSPRTCAEQTLLAVTSTLLQVSGDLREAAEEASKEAQS